MAGLVKCIGDSNLSKGRKKLWIEELNTIRKSNENENISELLFIQEKRKEIIFELNNFKESIGEMTTPIEDFVLPVLEDVSIIPIVIQGRNMGFYNKDIAYVNKENYDIPNIVEQKVEIEDLKNYVTEKAKSVERTPLTNVETLQKIIATKMFFELPITVQPEIPTIREKLNTYLNPTNNYDYLVTDFIADFNKEKIREGRKNSRKYKDYYSNFEINEKGIILKNSDPITIKLMESYISEDMKNYLSSTDQIQLEVYDDMITRELKREYYLEYPKALPIFEGNYNPINQNTISSKESMDFLRLSDNRVFEQTDSIEDTFFYSNVTDKEQPKLDIEKRDYENLQPTASVTNIKNLYTKAVEQEIDKELECK
jgi:hypothetical protein